MNVLMLLPKPSNSRWDAESTVTVRRAALCRSGSEKYPRPVKRFKTAAAAFVAQHAMRTTQGESGHDRANVRTHCFGKGGN